MHRFFVKPNQIKEETIDISGDDFNHITRVLRLKKDEKVEICDGQGQDYGAILDHVEESHVFFTIQSQADSKGENKKVHLTLFQGIPKGTKMDVITQKATELGVETLIPFSAKRSIVQLNAKKKATKTVRWQRVAYEAAKQSKRGSIPTVEAPQTFSEMLQTLKNYPVVLLAYEAEKTQTLKAALEKLPDNPQKIAVLIGPEGGFSTEEVDQIIQEGGESISLGNRILRTETAGPTVLAQINFFFNE